MKAEKQSLITWLKELNPKQQIRIFEMVIGTSGGLLTALILHRYIIPEEAPINGHFWILCGGVGLFFGYRNWRDSW